MYTTKLNYTTKKAQKWIDEYKNSSCYSVRNFYKNCSSRKIAIEQEIIKKMDENNCYGYRVLSGNSSFFTCGYRSKDDSIIYIETIGNTYKIM